MKVFEANITYQVSNYLNESLKSITSFEFANQKINNLFKIIDFFENNKDLEALKTIISNTECTLEEERAEYGDFQTNIGLANRVASYLVSKSVAPNIIIEPTCGKGNFIIASLQNFKEIKTIIGVEIYKPYVWETKFNILNYYLDNPQIHKPNISITHANVFDFNFKQIAKQYANDDILIIGNPPWVTNAKLGSLNSSNLPKKTNFKNHSGLDAMTGKGNFDIAEYITLMMINTFQTMKGHLVLLIKNSVIKNIVSEQNKNLNNISVIEKHSIDSKKEFNVSVEASLFYCKLNTTPTFYCDEFNFYDNIKPHQKFGWLNNKFVSNIDTYLHTKDIDGQCPFIWRQGLKHDCSYVMELEKLNGHYINGLKEEAFLEDDLVYGLLKSSDLKNTVIHQTRKYTIVTQKKVGQDTKYIKCQYPKTYQYLTKYQNNFAARKSSIYIGKPLFSIFGIGDYSFKPFKVAISGLYKTFHFTLIMPQEGKPVMLDDTCYLIGFDTLEYAVYTLILLNSETAVQFLKSITFSDAKRTFTKDVLMRIDLLALSKHFNNQTLNRDLDDLNKMYQFDITLNHWDNFIKEILPVRESQMLCLFNF